MKSKHILVTGGGSGIGLATVEKLVELETVTTVFDRSENALAEVKARFGDRVRTFHGDALSQSDLAEAISFASNSSGQLHGIFGNAGVPGPAGISELESEDWSRVLGVNVTALGLLVKLARPALTKSGTASVVLTSSVAGMIALGSQPAYTASKGAVIALTRALGNELAADGIRVNSVAPGFIDTPMLRDFFQKTYSNAEEHRVKVAEAEAALPAGRFGKPSEIADAVVFLLSNKATYISGVTLAVDGGLSSMK